MDINHEQLKVLVKKGFEIKEPIFVHGATGIGKSIAVRDIFKEIAEENGRIFVEWSDLSEKEKQDMLNGSGKNLREHLIFVDDRVSLKDNTDNKGIPQLDNEYLRWVKTLVMNLASKPDAMIVFFKDEFNLAPPSVQSAEFQIILDRALDDLSFGDDVYVLAAGNRMEDKANVFDMSPPLNNRFSHVTLNVPTVSDWTTWALKNQIDERIIGFLNFQEGALWRWKPDDKDPAFPTPRSWMTVSKYIKGVTDTKLIKLYSSSKIGDGKGIEFTKFVELGMKINLDDFLKNPKKIKTLGEKMDLKYAIVSSAIERYRKKPEILETMAEFIRYFNPEFSIYMLKMIRGTDDALSRNYFKQHIRNTKVWGLIKSEYAKFLV